MSGYQHDGLQCAIVKLECDFRRNEAWVYLADGDCCDMSGCIAFVTSICPAIDRIYTLSGSKPDTAYFRHGDMWNAIAHTDGQYVVIER